MSRYAKAIATFFGTLIGSVGTWGVTAVQDGGISDAEYFGLLIALSTVFATTAAVFGVPNTPPAGQAADPQMSEQHEPKI